MTIVLDPSERQVYWEPLAPPPGYELDTAVATTYSLDLQALIMAAVPMAFGSLDLEEDGLPDQVQALASLQRVARRTTVFCQQAQIAEPRQYSRLFSLLEPVVAEVQAPHGGAFHPKMWLARYAAEDRDPCYRLIVLSRNLTLDRSWDAMFVTEGRLSGHTARFRKPLVDFVAALPDLCTQPLDDGRRKVIEQLAEELWRVRFDRPPGVSHWRYRPTGIDGYDSLKTEKARRRLVISPFLSDSTVSELFDDVTEGIVISREEALDGLRSDTLESLSTCRFYYWLDDAADEPSDDELDEAAAGYEPDAGEMLHGLHAKIIVTERDDQARVLIGSANATDAAFDNYNVEFGIELRGKVEDLGIDRILPPEDDNHGGEATLSDLLLPYQRGPDFEPPPEPRLEAQLRRLRSHIVALDLGLAIKRRGHEKWDLRIEPAGETHALREGATVGCRPISREQAGDLRDASALWRGGAVVLEGVSQETLTTFILFEITLAHQDECETKRLVMNLPIREGAMPEQRENRLLANMIRDSDGFLRYLLMLLWNENAVDLMEMGLSRWLTGRGRRSSVETLPLLEELVNAFSNAPERLDEIEELMRRLQRTEEGREIVPDDFWLLWEAFKAARGELDE